mgnify:CR=1 FL=1
MEISRAFWTPNDLGDEKTYSIIGEDQRPGDLDKALEALYPEIDGLIDECASRPDQIHILTVGGDNACWTSGGGLYKMHPFWNGAMILIRAHLCQRIEWYRAAGVQLKVMVLDGAAFYKTPRKPARDSYHFLPEHDDYRTDEGKPCGSKALFRQYILKCCRLACPWFAQPLPCR